MNKYFAVRVKQHANSPIVFYVFVASAKNIVEWAHADSIKLDKGNVQRELIDARWRQITRFFKASENNVIPTSVTIAFDETLAQLNEIDATNPDLPGFVVTELGDERVMLTFPDSVVNNAYIIDGQHRLKGMSAFEHDIYVPVCLFVNLSKLERAFQFVTINNKSHKVPTDNLKALIANFESIQGDLLGRLTQASITTPRFATSIDVLNELADGPFYKMIDWVNNRHEDGKKLIAPSGLENSLKAIVRAFPETKEDDADALVVLNAIWRTIFTKYEINKDTAEQYPNLILKATIQAVSEMIVEKLRSDADPAFTNDPITANNGGAAVTTTQNLITGIPIEFWKDSWKLKSLDTSAGRAIIQGDIRELKKVINLAKGEEVEWKSKMQVFKDPMGEED